MIDNWKEIEDTNEPCSSSNGWCGWCGECREHSEDLHRQVDWEDE